MKCKHVNKDQIRTDESFSKKERDSCFLRQI